MAIETEMVGGVVYKVESKLLIGLIGAMFFIICTVSGVLFSIESDRISTLEAKVNADATIDTRLSLLEADATEFREYTIEQKAANADFQKTFWDKISHIDAELADIRGHMKFKDQYWGAKEGPRTIPSATVQVDP